MMGCSISASPRDLTVISQVARVTHDASLITSAMKLDELSCGDNNITGSQSDGLRLRWGHGSAIKKNGFLWDVITYPCPNFNGSVTKLPLNLGYGWLIDVITHPYPKFNGSLAKLPLNLGYGWLIDVITHPYPYFNGSLAKLPLKLGHGWVITSHTFMMVWLLVPALILMRVAITGSRGDRWSLSDGIW